MMQGSIFSQLVSRWSIDGKAVIRLPNIRTAEMSLSGEYLGSQTGDYYQDVPNTFPLFEQNKNLFHSVRLIDMTDKAVRPLTRKTNLLPTWVAENDLAHYLI